MTVFLVFKTKPKRSGLLVAIEIQGAFSTRKKAEKACVSWYHCVCPLELDERLPEKLVKPWPGAYFPMAAAVKAKKFLEALQRAHSKTSATASK